MSSLTIVVPTVAGREAWLSEALSSIKTAIGSCDVAVVVSGNGTTEESSSIAAAHGFRFVQHDRFMSAEDHARRLPSLVTTRYFWLFADDDIMPGDAVSVVVRALDDHPNCVALFGCARSFSDAADLGFGAALPLEIHEGVYDDFRELVAATKGEAHLGAIVMRTSLLENEDYERFLGTYHAFFGQVWICVERHIDLGVVVVPKVLVDFRMGDKAWDDSYIQTGAGLSRYFSLLPSELTSVKLSARTRLPVREFARIAWLFHSSDARYLREFSRNYKGFLARTSPLLVPVASPFAKFLKSPRRTFKR